MCYDIDIEVMIMVTQVAKWGNSQGIRMDKRMLSNLGLCVGDTIEIKNGQVCLFRGEKQLRLGKSGALCVLKGTQVKPQIATV